MALSVQAQLKKVLAPFARAVGVDIKKLKDGKQDKLQAGLNIQISEEGVISATAPNQAPDLSAYSTTEQINTLVDGKVAGLVKEEALDFGNLDLVAEYEAGKNGTVEDAHTITGDRVYVAAPPVG